MAGSLLAVLMAQRCECDAEGAATVSHPLGFVFGASSDLMGLKHPSVERLRWEEV